MMDDVVPLDERPHQRPTTTSVSTHPLPLLFLTSEPGATSPTATWQPNDDDGCRRSSRHPLASYKSPHQRPTTTTVSTYNPPPPLSFLTPEPDATSPTATWQPHDPSVLLNQNPQTTSFNSASLDAKNMRWATTDNNTRVLPRPPAPPHSLSCSSIFSKVDTYFPNVSATRPVFNQSSTS